MKKTGIGFLNFRTRGSPPLETGNIFSACHCEPFKERHCERPKSVIAIPIYRERQSADKTDDEMKLQLCEQIASSYLPAMSGKQQQSVIAIPIYRERQSAEGTEMIT